MKLPKLKMPFGNGLKRWEVVLKEMINQHGSIKIGLELIRWDSL
jgi:hypothetical protein